MFHASEEIHLKGKKKGHTNKGPVFAQEEETTGSIR